jgi:PadR family transcriptional regulator, regulatory protein PadR
MVEGMAKRPELLPGTLDMLILKTLSRGSMHGYGIALSIKRLSDEVLTVEEGSLYPGLQRLLLQGWVKAEWKMTETNRRARYYTLTATGRKQLGLELSQFEQMIVAIGRILQDA